ncbi:hypothetical protein AAG570_008123 [Ranatra chinensis]|uniref:SPT2 homolog N-terminal domain-containing protein n=1 Tax=Ranatra chinensis TaxID=642074 RepID=A0ABD0XVU0_9HEMI
MRQCKLLGLTLRFFLSKVNNHQFFFCSDKDRCYTTTYEAPKKIERSKVSSENIKKFLARKEEEEKKKLLEAKKKKDELLALRSQDKKAQKRVQVMLKRTKSANKSECDEDDYGYVSQEASAFYNKLIDKYQNMPVEKSLFSKGKREVKDLNAAKDRVKAALQKEADDELLPHKRKRKKKDDQETTEQESMPCDGKESKKIDSFDDRSKREEPLKKKPVRSMPPPVDFKQLLKIAEKKQFEPIVIEKIAEDKEERPMTKKEKLEYMKEQERKFKRVTGKPPHQEKDNQISEKSLVSEKNRSEKHKSTQHEKIQKNKVNQNDVTTEIKNSTENKKPILSNEKGSNKSDRVMPSSQIDEKLKKSAEVWAKPCNISNKLLNKNNHMKKPILPNIEKNKKSGAIQKTVSNNTKCQNITEKKPVNITELSEIDREIELLRRKRELLANRSITNEKKEIKPTVNNNNKPRPKVIKDAKPRQLVNPKKAKLNKS